MPRLEDLAAGASIRGLAPEGLATVASANWYGDQAVERLAMEAVMAAERALGREPRDVSDQRGLGYDIESKDPAAGHLYFIEVKEREEGATSVSLTKNEILYARNQPDQFRLAIVLVGRDGARAPVYVLDYDFGQPGFEQTRAAFLLGSLLNHGEGPA